MNLQDYIESNPSILFGKPVIKGTRISVELILEKFGEGASESDILNSYPHINSEQIHACFLFAAKYLKAEDTFPILS